MEYAVIVIFKNGMKLDKVYDRMEQARNVACQIAKHIAAEPRGVYFAQTHFDINDVLCVTWQEVKENDKK